MVARVLAKDGIRVRFPVLAFYKMKIKNPKVVVLSIIALICLVLAFVKQWWLLIIPAVVIYFINRKELGV